MSEKRESTPYFSDREMDLLKASHDLLHEMWCSPDPKQVMANGHWLKNAKVVIREIDGILSNRESPPIEASTEMLSEEKLHARIRELKTSLERIRKPRRCGSCGETSAWSGDLPYIDRINKLEAERDELKAELQKRRLASIDFTMRSNETERDLVHTVEELKAEIERLKKWPQRIWCGKARGGK